MRIRSIKPEFWADAMSGEWDARLALFYVGTWQVADDAGRLRLDPRLIRAELDPFDAKFGGTDGVAGLVEQLVRLGRILPYEVEGQRYGLVARFAVHQRIDKPTKSRLPEPPEGLRECSANPPGVLPRKEVVDQGSGIREQGNRDQVPGSDGPPSPSAPARAKRGGKKPEPVPDPRHRPLQQRLEAVFRETRGGAYGFAPRDAKALTELLRLSSGDAAEVERRWRIALGEVGFRRADSMHELASKWNCYAASGASDAGAARNLQVGVAAPRPAAAFRGGELDLATGLPELDPAWLEKLPEADRPRALAEWGDVRARVADAAYPDARARLLREAQSSFQERFARPASLFADAGGVS